MADYNIGTGDPTITPDPGAGAWNSKRMTADMMAFKVSILQVLPAAYAVIGDDAVKHMYHYLGNSGRTYTIDLKDMLDDVGSAKKLFDVELVAAKAFVETLPHGVHQVTSRKATGGYNYKSENWNWFYAIGGYSIWGKGVAKVDATGSVVHHRLDFELKFYDRYNWDGGKSVTILGIKITDDMMGELHRQGLAREFDCVGSVKETVFWDKAKTASPKPVPKPVAPVIKNHVVKPGENLSKIAELHYGSQAQWVKIYAANKSVIGANPNMVRPGQKLVIP